MRYFNLSRFSWTRKLLEMPKETFKTRPDLLLLLPEAVGNRFAFNPGYQIMNLIVKQKGNAHFIFKLVCRNQL